MAEKTTQKRRYELVRYYWLATIVLLLSGVIARFLDAELLSWILVAGALISLVLSSKQVSQRVSEVNEQAKELKIFNLMRVASEVAKQLPSPYRSLHDLLEDWEPLRPKAGGRVDAVFDAAHVPERFLHYAESLHADGTEIRVLFLDPDSALVESHPLAREHDSGADYVRSKMRKTIEQVARHATVRLYDALPLGQLMIVDDHIIWGGIAGIAADVSLPMVQLKVDTHGHIYWAFRRNFDTLWDRATPVAPAAPALVATP